MTGEAIKTNELAASALGDGQTIRPFIYYFQETFEGLKGKEFDFDQVRFNDPTEFYRHLRGVLDMMITAKN